MVSAVAVGASAGGVEALLELVAALVPDLPAPVLVTLHQPADAATVLPQLLARRSRLPAEHARDGEELAAGRIYVAPPDRHLLVDKGVAVLSRGPKEIILHRVRDQVPMRRDDRLQRPQLHLQPVMQHLPRRPRRRERPAPESLCEHPRTVVAVQLRRPQQPLH